MENKKFCVNCGAQLSLTAKFCGKCGTKVDILSDKSEEAAATAEVKTEETVKAEETVCETAEENTSGLTEETVKAEEAVCEAEETVGETVEAAVKDVDGAACGAVEEISGTSIYSAEEQAQLKDGIAGKPEDEETTEKAKKSKKERQGIGLLPCIMLMIVAILTSVALTLLLLKFTGHLDNNTIILQNEHQPVNQGSTTVDGHEVKNADNVTINVSGSENLATAIYAKCAKSVVGIRVVYEKSATPWSQSTIATASEGSGVIYLSDGYILTNNHVIEATLDENGSMRPGYSVQVFLDKSLSDPYVAEVVGADAVTDLALLKIDAAGLTPMEFASESDIEIGETVFSIGSPGGLEFMNSICDGIISGIGRNILMEDGYAYDLIQTTAAINPGNSGGALINSSGKLVGICSLKIASSSYDDMCFAISCNTVSQVASALKTYGKVERPQMGVTINTNYNATEAASSGLPAGAWVNSVTKNGPADKAGIKANSIITAIAGNTVTDYTSLRTELLKHKVGEKIKVTVYEYNESKKSKNGGEYKEYEVVLESAG